MDTILNFLEFAPVKKEDTPFADIPFAEGTETATVDVPPTPFNEEEATAQAVAAAEAEAEVTEAVKVEVAEAKAAEAEVVETVKTETTETEVAESAVEETGKAEPTETPAGLSLLNLAELRAKVEKRQAENAVKAKKAETAENKAAETDKKVETAKRNSYLIDKVRFDLETKDMNLKGKALWKLEFFKENLAKAASSQCIGNFDGLIDHLKSRCEESESLCSDIIAEHKTVVRCRDYIFKQARKAMEDARNGKENLSLSDETVYEWAEDYFRADDLEEIRKQEAKEAERKTKAEQAEAVRKAKAAKKAAKEAKESGKASDTAEKGEPEKAEPKPKAEKKAVPKKKFIEGQMDFFSLLNNEGGC